MRKAQSMYGRPRTNKFVQQQEKVSLQEKLEKEVTVETVANGENGTANQVDHPVVAVRSKSPSQDLGEKASPVDSNSSLVENGENSTMTTENLAEPVKPVEPVTQPSTSSSTAKGTCNFILTLNSEHLNNQDTCQ